MKEGSATLIKKGRFARIYALFLQAMVNCDSKLFASSPLHSVHVWQNLEKKPRQKDVNVLLCML
jgi:hypothetical protein